MISLIFLYFPLVIFITTTTISLALLIIYLSVFGFCRCIELLRTLTNLQLPQVIHIVLTFNRLLHACVIHDYILKLTQSVRTLLIIYFIILFIP